MTRPLLSERLEAWLAQVMDPEFEGIVDETATDPAIAQLVCEAYRAVEIVDDLYGTDRTLGLLRATISNLHSSWCFFPCSRAVPVSVRAEYVRASFFVFSSYFDSRLGAEGFLAADSRGPSLSPMRLLCCMWWDIAPASVWVKCEDTAIADAVFETLERILRLSSVACQEAALHGLGHLVSPVGRGDVSSRAVATIDAYLEREGNRAIDSIRVYARQARGGQVQ